MDRRIARKLDPRPAYTLDLDLHSARAFVRADAYTGRLTSGTTTQPHNARMLREQRLALPNMAFSGRGGPTYCAYSRFATQAMR